MRKPSFLCRFFRWNLSHSAMGWVKNRNLLQRTSTNRSDVLHSRLGLAAPDKQLQWGSVRASWIVTHFHHFDSLLVCFQETNSIIYPWAVIDKSKSVATDVLRSFGRMSQQKKFRAAWKAVGTSVQVPRARKSPGSTVLIVLSFPSMELLSFCNDLVKTWNMLPWTSSHRSDLRESRLSFAAPDKQLEGGNFCASCTFTQFQSFCSLVFLNETRSIVQLAVGLREVEIRSQGRCLINRTSIDHGTLYSVWRRLTLSRPIARDGCRGLIGHTISSFW